jgi:flagellar M-ring protein FliF
VPGRGSETTNYEISRVTRHTVRPRGAIEKLSVAVILDNEAVLTKNGDGTVTRTTKPRAPETLQKIQGLVAAAVGLDTERGDNLTVENVPFEEAPIEDVPTVSTWQRVVPQAMDGVRVFAPFVLGLLALLLVVRPLMRRATGGVSVTAAPVMPAQLPKTVADLEGEIEAQLDAAVEEKTAGQRKLPVLARRVSTLTTHEPEHAARLLRMWMTEDAGK